MAIKKQDGATAKRPPRRTKDELVESYQVELAQVAGNADSELRPEQVAEKKKIEGAHRVADTASVEAVAGEIHDLKLSVGRALGELAEKLEQQVVRYQQLQTAIASKEAGLHEVYGIENAAGALAALIEAQNRRRDEFADEMATTKAALDEEIRTTREQWEKERKERDAQFKDWAAAEQQKRERTKTEFDYAFQREQQLARDQFNDAKAKLEKELALRREAAEKDVAAREGVLKAAETDLAELRRRSEQFPAELEQAVGNAVQAAVDAHKATAAAELNMARMEFEGSRNVLNSRIEALQATVKQQTEQLARMGQQQELAYEKVQNIALKAIEGTSAREIASSLQDLLTDQLKKQKGGKDQA